MMSAESPSLQKSVSIATDNDAPALPPEDHPSDAPPHMNGSSKASSFPPPPPPPPPLPPERSVGGGGDQDDTAAIAAASSAPPPPTASATGARQRRHHRNNHRRSRVDPSSRRGGDGRRSVVLSGGSPADNDASYCTEIARRSVARAALHLGMEGMEGEALDVLGSVLLGYMEMVGTAISTNVELSGRSSAHSNAYDAINAIAKCTAPAAMQLGSAHPSSKLSSAAAGDPLHPNDGDDRGSSRMEGRERGWEGLASFLFGPDWFSIPLEGDDDARAASGGSSHTSAAGNDGGISSLLQNNGKTFSPAPFRTPGGKTLLPSRPNSATNSTFASPKVGKGKQLSNMIGIEKAVSFNLDRQHSAGGDGIMDTAFSGNDGGPSNEVSSGGWHAPYLDAVAPFPLLTSAEAVANPHRLSGTKIPLSMHNLATEAEACRETPSSTIARRGGADEPDSKLARLRDEVAEKAMRAALRIPDDVYSTIGTVWGSIRNGDDSSNKKKTGIDGDGKPRADSKMTPPANNSSKVRFDVASTKQHPSEPNASASVRRPPYVPNFLPPFPTDHYSNMANDNLAASMATSAVMGNVLSRLHNREKRKSSEIASGDGVKKGVSDRDAVRRSVIGLGKSAGTTYWGSIRLDDAASNDGKGGAPTAGWNISNDGKLDVTVAPGDGRGSSSAAKKSGPDAGQVLPLGRASGSRLSKILEGSMNVS